MESGNEKITAALNLYRRLPPSKAGKNIGALTNLLPDQADKILTCVESPLGNEFYSLNLRYQSLKTTLKPQNGDSYRSPWSNTYFPETESDFFPTQKLRRMEQIANEMLIEYEKLYYKGGLANSYFWNKDGDDFSCCVVIKKNIEAEQGVKDGSWNSINLFEVNFDQEENQVCYKLMTTIFMEISTNNQEHGNFMIMGNTTKKSERTLSLPDREEEKFHLENICGMVEEAETFLRQANLDSIFLGKTKQAVQDIRYEYENQKVNQQQGQKTFLDLIKKEGLPGQK